MNSKFTLLRGTLLALICGIVTPAMAQQMNYQGRLTDNTGAPLQDGQYTITFELFSNATGGFRAWGPFICDGVTGDGHGPKADLVNGRFNVILGPDDTNGAPMLAAVSQARFLQITVAQNPPLLPRQEMFAAPLALHAETAGRAAIADSIAGDNVAFENDAFVAGDLTVNGTVGGVVLHDGNVQIPGGASVSGILTNAGAIHVKGTAALAGIIDATDALRLLGAGSSEASRRIDFLSPVNAGSITASGNITASRLVAGQLSNGSETWNIGELFINKPPIIIDTLPSLNNTINHQILGAPGVGYDIKDYIDDPDGCRMRITLIHKIDHQVRFLDAHLTVAPRHLTLDPNRATRLNGRTLQQPGSGELNWTIDDTALSFIIDAWPGPWIRCLDFYPGVPIGGTDQLPTPDPNKIRVWFHLHPHVAAQIVILD